jgi:hypothetical protein
MAQIYPGDTVWLCGYLSQNSNKWGKWLHTVTSVDSNTITITLIKLPFEQTQARTLRFIDGRYRETWANGKFRACVVHNPQIHIYTWEALMYLLENKWVGIEDLINLNLPITVSLFEIF